MNIFLRYRVVGGLEATVFTGINPLLGTSSSIFRCRSNTPFDNRSEHAVGSKPSRES